MADVLLWREPDGIFLVYAKGNGRPLGTFYAEPDGWWVVNLANGRTFQTWGPNADPDEITRRLVRKR
ncbi:hypothetical protein ACFVYR_30850 [Streptomyces sp. NPDC058284]|uniref:hypothetical protein n=1 Tax=unclassified Streptomyces TaxID=2593676 RepID=UPI003646A593